MNTVCRVLTRKKILDPVSTEQSELGRVLNTVDLTALGIGSTLGVGVYVLAGHVARDTAGPAVVLSFLIATIASVFAGLCYAEFGSRAPRAGSAYIYSYVCVGEFVAFVIGWNLILEYVIGSASVARGLSLYLDTLINNTLQTTFEEIAPLGDVAFISKYFDFFAFGISVLLAAALAFGLKESSWANNIFTLVNLLVVIFVIIAGATKAQAENWHLNVTNICTNSSDPKGSGGFFPFGVDGMIKGAATCFYGFVGFDCIATTGEEVKNPKRAIPLAIIISLFVIFLAYFGTSTVVTLMVPYCDQDPNAPLPHAFEVVGLNWAKWVVAIGGIFGLCASLFGAMFPLPRIIYAMASDSLIFNFLGRVSARFQTPVIGTLLAGLLTGLMAALFELKQLVNMMSIGTLLAYTIVATSVLLLRYEVDKGDIHEPLLRSFSDSEDNETYTDNRGLDVGESSEEIELINDEITSSNILKQIFNCGRREYPSEVTEKIVKVEVCIYCILCVGIGLCAMYLKQPIANNETWAIVLTAIVVSLAVLVIMSMTTQPKSRRELTFKVPLVPLIPALSILINIYLMLMLDPSTWIRFGIWMAVGLPTYYFSVKINSDARNESIYSRSSITANGKVNGVATITFNNNDPEKAGTVGPTKKRPAPPPPALIEAIADLDEMLENEEANINNDRKYSLDSLSTASNVLREENIQADVHCSDVDLPPTKEAPPLLKSSDVYPPPVYSDVADFPHASFSETDNIDDHSTDTVTENNPKIDSLRSDVSQEQIDQAKTDLEKETIEEIIEENSATVDLTETEGPSEKNNEVVVKRIEKMNEDDTDAEKNEPIIPPPPPPLQETEEIGSTPKLQFKLSDLTNVKLKPVQDKNPANQSTSTVVPQNDNIKFGTQEYKEFLEQLDNKLQQGGLIPVHLAAELKHKPITNANVMNENVIEDNIDRSDAKEKLAEFLERTNSLPLFNNRNVVHPIVKGNQNEKESDLSDFKAEHRKNMENIFRSVRLREQDNFKDVAQPENAKKYNSSEDLSKNSEIVKEVRKENNSDRLQHRQNMDNIFRSIRLRKVDSFKSNESQ